MLIDTNTLATRLNDPSLRVLDCRADFAGSNCNLRYGIEQFVSGHIPGSLPVNLESDLCGPILPGQARHPLPEPAEFQRKIQSWGIEPDSEVIVYDDKGGMLAAARLWWMLHVFAGIKKVYLLDGGFPAWVAGNFPIESGPHVWPVAASKVCTVDSTNVASANLIEKSGHGLCLVDARANDRFKGQNETIDPVAGHIPGAISLPCMANLDERGFFLSPERLHERFVSAGVGREIVHYCGSGVTACHNYFAMTLAKLPAGKVYIGSWSDWISNKAHPIATQSDD